MSKVESALPVDERLADLARLENEASRRRFLERHADLVSPETVQRLSEVVVRTVRVDTHESLRLADAAVEIAGLLQDEGSTAYAMRARANALYASGDNRSAVEHHERAFRIFESLQEWNEAARTLSASIQPLILLGEYDRAFAASERAREIFTRLNLPWRLARLEINVGNIFHREDRFEEALAHYECACEGLLAHKDAEGMAVVLGNMAVCLISLNDFPRALAAYERARTLSEQSGMPLLVSQADYNIAYLYYLRGEYSRAIEMLYATRKSCADGGDAYHHALCHLDLSEIYLELNLSDEACEMAREGFQRFEKLGMGYEAAKTLANQAIAFGQQGRTMPAIESFTKAREMFTKEKNLVWPWLIDLYQALLLFREGRHFEARRLCLEAAAFFDKSLLTGKALLAHLLLGRIALQTGELDTAQREADLALQKLAAMQSPLLTHQTHFLLGEIAMARQHLPAAYAAFQEARKPLESLRSKLQGEELKISFAKDRLKVYEALVDLCLTRVPGSEFAEEALGYMEAAKSRSLIEMIFPTSRAADSQDSGQSSLVRRIRDLREELNWYYHRIELEQLRPEERSAERIEELRKQAHAHESELLRGLRELPAQHQHDGGFETVAEFSLEKLRAALPEKTALIEYYSAGERIVSVVVTPQKIEIVPLTVVSRVSGLLDLLRFQFAKFSIGGEYLQRFGQTLLRATDAHLASLYEELMAPLLTLLDGVQHLVIVPHGSLHYFPFHAMRIGEDYLCDRFTVSYAPSAQMFALCQSRPPSARGDSLILGIPDLRAPQILAEVQSVASMLPHPELLIGDRATASALREKGSDVALLHIATHGTYRQDNPMFSGIRLGDGYLNLYDLYQMRLGADLVTLSGCATGMNVVAGGDELLGLQRGLFRAGATSLLLSLWDVHDRSTAELMRHFYARFIEGGSAARALQYAMNEIRKQYPHPYFWAPFVLVGKIADSKRLS